MSEYAVTRLVSKNGKYHIDHHRTVVYAGKNYHSFVVYEKIRNYFQQVASGVNWSDNALQEYLDETV